MGETISQLRFSSGSWAELDFEMHSQDFVVMNFAMISVLFGIGIFLRRKKVFVGKPKTGFVLFGGLIVFLLWNVLHIDVGAITFDETYPVFAGYAFVLFILGIYIKIDQKNSLG